MTHHATGVAASPLSIDQAALDYPTDSIPYDLIFGNAIVGICFMHRRHFLKINSRMEEMFGYAPGELNGRNVRELYVNDEEFMSVGSVYAAPAQSNAYVHERMLVKKNGDIIWCLISGRSVDPQQADAPWVWVVQDINARKLAEDALSRANDRLEHTVERRTLNLQRSNRSLQEEVARRRESEREMVESREKYRALFRNIPSGIFVTDERGVIVEINPGMTQLTGLANLEQFAEIACDPACLVNEYGAALSLNDFIRARFPVIGRPVERFSIKWRRSEGVLIDLDVLAVRLTVSGLGAAFLFDDVTEKRHAREREHEQQRQLAHASRLSVMGQFASALAHELGQPLNASLGYVAGIRNRLAGVPGVDPDVYDALERVDMHLQQAGDVIANVRSFVSRHRPEDSEIHLTQLVRQTVDLMKMHLLTACVQVKLRESPIADAVRGNRVELQQVIINLMMNAIDAMEQTPKEKRVIEIRLNPASESRISLRIIDHGPGVVPALREQIFEPYYSTKPSGIGLGLMMCRTIVESHGGTLKYIEHPRSGAIFKILLPLS
ncbi:MAG: PAS domain S-box protein [Telluria sp.]|nr:PAS domain S-box protein [Telluria sp.]